MPEAYTASYNPVTGERREFRQEVAPPPPPDYGMSSINPAAVEQLYRTQKIEDANKAVSAAIQFQGMRGYQEALKRGDPAEKALARYGPMMFYSKPQAFAPSVRALTPPQVPQITPYQRESLDIQKQRLAKPPAMTPYQQESIRLREMELSKPPPPQMATISEKVEEFKGSPEVQARPFKQRGSGIFDRLIPDQQARDYQPARPPHGEQTITRKVPVDELGNQTAKIVKDTLSERAAAQATGPETKRFKSESEAREAGSKAGDVVYLVGVGKVRLK